MLFGAKTKLGCFIHFLPKKCALNQRTFLPYLRTRNVEKLMQHVYPC